MLAKVLAGAPLGIDAYPVEVEVDIAQGLPQLPPSASPKGRSRKARTASSRPSRTPATTSPPAALPSISPPPTSARTAPPTICRWPSACSPPRADCRPSRPGATCSCGELSLDGRIKPVRGLLPVSAAARRWRGGGDGGAGGQRRGGGAGRRPAGLPGEHPGGGGRVPLRAPPIEPYRVDVPALLRAAASDEVDFADVSGQEHVKRALEVAAAGGHNLLMVGPPGTRQDHAGPAPADHPAPSRSPEALETTKIYSVAGLLPPTGADRPAPLPLAAPHHLRRRAGRRRRASRAPARCRWPTTACCSSTSCRSSTADVLEVLRQPLEDGQVTHRRARMSRRPSRRRSCWWRR